MGRINWAQGSYPDINLGDHSIALIFITTLDGEEATVLLYLSQNDSVFDIKGSQFAWQGKIRSDTFSLTGKLG